MFLKEQGFGHAHDEATRGWKLAATMTSPAGRIAPASSASPA